MVDSLERIYRAVPAMECKGLCTAACGPIDMAEEERRRIAARGVTIPTPTDAVLAMVGGADPECPALVDGQCSVYEDRPLICRMWGAVESLPCPYGCEPAHGLLMDAGAQSLIRRSLALRAEGPA